MRISVTPGRDWHPLNSTSHYDRPDTGSLVALDHAVWKVTKVEDAPLSEEDEQKWLKAGAPDLATWKQRPYRVHLRWMGGLRQAWFKSDEEHPRARVSIRANGFVRWPTYRGDRWPQCSCCGEPMPCRAEIQDQQVQAGLDQLAQLEAIPPGACWGCAEVITTRQKSVTYPGENLDLPGGPQVRFHIRKGCHYKACAYEERWLAGDPRRERVLTWPKCNGLLVVHADGSSECVSERDPAGGKRESQPDCRGHLTHDHSTQTACYAQGNYLRPGEWDDASCPRGCKRAEHHGIRAQSLRPERRQTDGLFK